MATNLINFPTPLTILTQDLPTSPPKKVEEKITSRDGDLTLYRRAEYANSCWQYRLKLPDGTTERRSTHKRDLKDAELVADNRWQEVRWRDAKQLSQKAISFEDAAIEFIDEYRRQFRLDGKTKDASMEKNIKVLREHVMPYFAGKALNTVTARNIDSYHRHYENKWKKGKTTKRVIFRKRDCHGTTYAKPLRVLVQGSCGAPPSANTVARTQSLLQRIFKHALKMGHITALEVPAFSTIKETHARRGRFDADEQVKLLDHLEIQSLVGTGDQIAMRYLLLLYVEFHLLTGLRPGVEGNQMCFSDILYRAQPSPHYVVNVRDGKTGARQVIAHARLGDVLKRIKAQHPGYDSDAGLWQRPSGVLLVSFTYQFAQVLRDLKMSRDRDHNKRTLYSLRHTMISDAIERGVSLSVIAKNTGTSVAMLGSHYDHILHTNQVSEVLRGL